jgi:serine/threonine protein kinase
MTAQTRSVAIEVCPPREKLIAYNLGALLEADIDHLAAHLEHCSACLQTLSGLDDGADSLVISLAALRDEGSVTGLVDDEVRILQLLAGISDSFPARGERKPPPRQVGPYEILEPLAEGGMGAVYTARHIHLGRIVALKLLSADRVADAPSITRFMQEMKTLGQLSHPNIVQAFDAGVEHVPFLAMEYLKGMDLARLVKERGPMSVTQACECVRQAGLALQYASMRGLVHRDIKPANLMLTPDGCVKVLDLGLARFGSDLLSDSDAPSRGDAITSVGAVL